LQMAILKVPSARFAIFLRMQNRTSMGRERSGRAGGENGRGGEQVDVYKGGVWRAMQ